MELDSETFSFPPLVFRIEGATRIATAASTDDRRRVYARQLPNRQGVGGRERHASILGTR